MGYTIFKQGDHRPFFNARESRASPKNGKNALENDSPGKTALEMDLPGKKIPSVKFQPTPHRFRRR